MTINYILIDGSYFIFYRYYALLAWWKLAKQDETIEIPIDNEEFVEKFKKTSLSANNITVLGAILGLSGGIIFFLEENFLLSFTSFPSNNKGSLGKITQAT